MLYRVFARWRIDTLILVLLAGIGIRIFGGPFNPSPALSAPQPWASISVRYWHHHADTVEIMWTQRQATTTTNIMKQTELGSDLDYVVAVYQPGLAGTHTVFVVLPSKLPNISSAAARERLYFPMARRTR